MYMYDFTHKTASQFLLVEAVSVLPHNTCNNIRGSPSPFLLLYYMVKQIPRIIQSTKFVDILICGICLSVTTLIEKECKKT